MQVIDDIIVGFCAVIVCIVLLVCLIGMVGICVVILTSGCGGIFAAFLVVCALYVIGRTLRWINN